MDEDSLYGARLAASFRLDSHASVVARSLTATRLAATQIIFGNGHGLTEPIAPADGYLMIHRLSANPDHDLWSGGRQIDSHADTDQRIRLIDQTHGQSFADMREGSNSVVYYLPRRSIMEASEALANRRVSELDIQRNAALRDDTIHHLGLALIPSLAGADCVNQLLIDQLSLMISMHMVQRFGLIEPSRLFRRGGLAPWQERRAKEMLLHHMSGDLSLDEVAAECDLSAGYFARAFRVTTGQTAHKWLTDRRIALAKHKLERTDAALADIARDCGFADQSHLTRTFSRQVGYAPGAWRRARRA